LRLPEDAECRVRLIFCGWKNELEGQFKGPHNQGSVTFGPDKGTPFKQFLKLSADLLFFGV
jgi:hypothetical protein